MHVTFMGVLVADIGRRGGVERLLQDIRRKDNSVEWRLTVIVLLDPWRPQGSRAWVVDYQAPLLKVFYARVIRERSPRPKVLGGFAWRRKL